MDNREKIKKGQNILRIKLKSKNCNESSFDLMKIPIEWLYQEALREIGEQESYIEELNANIRNLQNDNFELRRTLELITEERSADSKKFNIEEYNATQYMLNSHKEEIEELRNVISDLITRITSRENTISELQKKLNEKE